jgi:acetyl esterase/lipase
MGLIAALTGLSRTAATSAGLRLLRGPRRPDWTLRHETLFTELRRRLSPVVRLDVAGQRALFESVVLPTPALLKVRRSTVAEDAPVRGEWLVPRAGVADRVIVYLHGGDYAVGSPRTHRDLAARLAVASGARALVLDYRLAPEAPFPAALDDALAALRWLRATGTPPSRVVVAGDSAGGGLSLAALLALRDAGEPLPAGAALLCPWVDLSLSSPSVRDNAPYDVLDVAVAYAWIRAYVPSGDIRDPRCSPLFADLRGLPPLLVHTGTAEVLHDECIELCKRAQTAGVPTQLHEAPGMVHGWHQLATFLPEARAAIAHVGAFVREVTRAASVPPAAVDAAPRRIQG